MGISSAYGPTHHWHLDKKASRRRRKRKITTYINQDT